MKIQDRKYQEPKVTLGNYLKLLVQFNTQGLYILLYNSNILSFLFELLFCLFHCICLYGIINVRLPLLQLLLLLLFGKNTDSYTQTIPHAYWGPTAGLAVGVSCLAIPLAGGVRPL